MTANSTDLVRADETASLWKSVLHTPSPRLSAATRDLLAVHTRVLERVPGQLRVAIDSSELDVWLRGGQLAVLEASLASVTDGAIALAVVPVHDVAALRADPSYTFASFIASPANAHARASAVAFARDARGAGALAVYGGPSAGKTHLLRAIAAAIGAARGEDHVLTCSAEQLSLELIRAIGADTIAEFRKRLDSVTALVIDDLDALAGRDATQEELAHSLEALRARKVPIAISLSKPPDRATGLVASLRAQLAHFTPLEVRAAEWETRVAIVLARARLWGVEPSASVASYLASRLRAQLGQLDPLLTRLMTRSLAGSALADLDVVRHLIASAAEKPLRISPDDALSTVARQFNLRVRDLRSSSRSARVTTPRQVAMYLMRRHCGLSYPEIGRRFARHHTTALHSDRVVQEQLAENASLRAAVVLIEKELLRLSEGGG
ncbi:MAG TPA: DnaA/Hda family protein [Myxococcota bacterium]|nr:DnaA/Hda family protein [Myxococcota bacterium]